jgi:hypothetical protein
LTGEGKKEEGKKKITRRPRGRRDFAEKNEESRGGGIEERFDERLTQSRGSFERRDGLVREHDDCARRPRRAKDCLAARQLRPTHPFRNAHFLSVAVSWAEAIGAGAIYIGAVAEDSSGYPDCRPEYYRVFQELIRVGTRPETQIEIVTPVITLKKSEIIRRGIELGAPLHLTWSCYQNEDTACGICDSCLLRLRAFAEAGVPDPIPYRRTVSAGR